MNTMTKPRETGKSVFSIAFWSLLLLAGPAAVANTTNTVPYFDTFEYAGAANGMTIIGTNGWVCGTNDTYATLTNMTYTYTNAAGSNLPRPLPNPHDWVVKLDTENAAVSNALNNPVINNVWIDTMVQFALWSDENPPVLTNEASIQAAFFVDTNGHLVIYHSVTPDGMAFSNIFTTLTNAPIASNDWVRLTVTMDYLTDENYLLQFFKVQLNGGDPLTSAEGYANLTSYTPGSPDNGPWHICAVNGASAPGYTGPTAIRFSGTGFIDDFVVTNGAPSFAGGGEPSTFTITSMVCTVRNGIILDQTVRGGSISPFPSLVVTQYSEQAYTLTASNYWHVWAIWIDGASNPAPASGVYTFSNVMANHSIQARYSENVVTNNSPTPHWWLAQYGLETNASGASYNDGDSLPAWQEYLAGTDPTNANSRFEIQSFYKLNGTNYLKWVTSPQSTDPNLPPFGLLKKTNLVNGAWTLVDGNITRAPNGTNIWAEVVSETNVPAFYRVTATNNP